MNPLLTIINNQLISNQTTVRSNSKWNNLVPSTLFLKGQQHLLQMKAFIKQCNLQETQSKSNEK